MKTVNLMTMLFAMVVMPNVIFAQNTKTVQAYWIHEDQVKPAMIKEYEAVTKDFIKSCKEHDLRDADWFTAQVNGGTYLAISPIKNMADLDKNTLAPLAEKMGEENFKSIFTRFDKCYDVHRDYVIHLIHDLSYMPGGITMDTPGEDYRKWHYLYVSPENVANLRKKLSEIKALYEKKEAKEKFRIYRNGFGSSGDFYLVAISAKDEQTYATTSDETDVLLGDEGKRLFEEMMQYVQKYEIKTGKMRPDLAYVAKPKTENKL